MPTRLLHLLALATALVLSIGVPHLADAAPQKGRARARATHRPAPLPIKRDNAASLNLLYDEYWDASMRLNPLQATFQNDYRFNDQLPNFLAPAARQQAHDFMVQWLGKVEAIGEQGLQGQDLLSYEIFVHDAHVSLAAEQYPSWMLPINPYNNLASIIAVLGSGTGAQPFRTVQDYDNWLHRAQGVPALFDQAIANMREGMAAGVVQPRALVEEVLPQLDAVIVTTAEDSLFWGPIRNLPDDFSDQDKTRLTADYKQMIEQQLLPAYRTLRGFMASDYLPTARASDGMGALPDGQAWYANTVAHLTTATVTPAQIHALGEQEVKSLQARIAAVMQEADIGGTPPALFDAMRTDRRFIFADETALLARYREVAQQVDDALPTLFATRPKAALEIKSTSMQYLPAASYNPPPVSDGSQPGVLDINVSNLASRKRWAVPLQYLHEAIPGYHLQLDFQQELNTLPRFRLHGGNVSFVGGWGLYAESLGEEMGIYRDPYDHLGYLQASLLHAVRMVADTGLHAAGWSRQQTIDYMVANADITPADADAEVERFMAQPGQALAGYMGALQIRDLREKARAGLGEDFDAREFHNEVLKDGSMPLDMLQARIERWITSPKTEAPADATPPQP